MFRVIRMMNSPGPGAPGVKKEREREREREREGWCERDRDRKNENYIIYLSFYKQGLIIKHIDFLGIFPTFFVLA